MTTISYREENNYPKAIVISAVLMGAFLLLSFFWLISSPVPEVGTGGIIMNYGTTDAGMGDDLNSMEEASQDPNANNKVPDKVLPNETPVKENTPETNEKSVATQDIEDAPEVKTSEKKSVKPPVTTPEKETKTPTVNQNALYKGPRNGATGRGDGTTTTPGNQGSVNGDPLSDNYNGGGSGNGEKAPPGRSFVNYPKIEDDGQITGIIVIRYRVSKSGRITTAQVTKGTTISDLTLQNKCINAMLNASMNSTDEAADEQIGVKRFVFRVK
ncbi:energy transducer TonB [Hufsiella ginkgonis]|uniref:Energy transducer TonB n=1 Tax=Hufsiella ginkgonis TaxID=2695274 RepID=A0A7K1Y0T6_9SPHI|nr:energy transducer TonB [Hufsiella ginkgonis]MXV16286.1 energy transducer TonB [Hufsiella ginkgonis]